MTLNFVPPGRPAPWLTVLFFLFCSSAQADGPLQVTQADGNTLALQAPASRLVALSPNLAELVFAAGAGDTLVGAVEYADYPPAAREIPRLGDAFRLDVERIVGLHPDLVLAWDSGNPRPALEQLRSLGLAVWSIEIREPDAIARVIEEIGRASGRSDKATREAGRIRQRLGDLQKRYAGASELDYFYQVDERPLYTINGDHLISRGLRLCGAHNVFAAESGLAFPVSREAVIVRDPDAMFAPLGEGDADPLAHWRSWPTLRAVRNGALFALPADEISRATPRLLDSLELACTLLQELRRRSTDG